MQRIRIRNRAFQVGAESLITSSISLKKGTDDVSDIYMNIFRSTKRVKWLIIRLYLGKFAFVNLKCQYALETMFLNSKITHDDSNWLQITQFNANLSTHLSFVHLYLINCRVDTSYWKLTSKLDLSSANIRFILSIAIIVFHVLGFIVVCH